MWLRSKSDDKTIAQLAYSIGYESENIMTPAIFLRREPDAVQGADNKVAIGFW